jgi:hypothetical protein
MRVLLSRHGWYLALLSWGLGIGDWERLGAQEALLPERVKEALGEYGRLKTLSITWTQRFQPGAIASARLDARRLESWSSPDACYLVWQDGKIFKRRDEGEKGAANSNQHEFAFDGRILAGGRHHGSIGGKSVEPQLGLNLAAELSPAAEYFGVGYFARIGIHLPRGVEELRGAKHLASEVLYLLEHDGKLESAEPATLDGRQLIRVAILLENPRWRGVQKTDPAAFERDLRKRQSETGRKTKEEEIQMRVAAARRARETTPRNLVHVFHLDPELGYAVRRWQEFTEDGGIRIQANCSEHQKVPGHEIWLPRESRTDYYVSDGEYPGEIFNTPFRTFVMEVVEFDTKPVPEDQFTLKYTMPGTVVGDNTLPESKLGHGPVSYTVPAKPEDLDLVIAEARAITEARAVGAKRVNWFKIMLISVNIVGLVGLLAYLVVRRRQKVAES